jgi:hypothetical protein
VLKVSKVLQAQLEQLVLPVLRGPPVLKVFKVFKELLELLELLEPQGQQVLLPQLVRQ